jgi:hypothetical protein
MFTLNGVIAGGDGVALLVDTDPILECTGMAPNPGGAPSPC